MPRTVHDALGSVTAAAAHLRSRLLDLAAAVEQGDEAAIAHHARALVQSSGAQAAMATESGGRFRDPHLEEEGS